jgi:hypothetical protein
MPGVHWVHCDEFCKLVTLLKVPLGQLNCVAAAVPAGQ